MIIKKKILGEVYIFIIDIKIVREFNSKLVVIF